MNGNLHRHIFQLSTCLKQEELKAYLRGGLAPADRQRVENHLLDCPLCSDAVEGFENQEGESLPELEDFEAFRKKLPFEEAGKVRRLTPASTISRVAALAAALVIGAVAYLNWFQPVDAGALYSQFYTAYPNDIPVKRGPGDEQLVHPALESALGDYSNGNYAASLPLFEEALAAEPGNDAAAFFAGAACLETGQWEKAARYFEKTRLNGGSYAPKATWYLALANLKLGKKEEARSLLEALEEPGGFKEKEAKTLLKKF